jgi:Ser/Thr protein kinase RdoA (MazF antagonist)
VSTPIIGHCDGGPWNIVGVDGLPVAFVDFEFAGPADALWELAEVAWLNAQLHDDDIAARHGLPDAAGRARQLRLLVDAYGLERPARAVFVDKMIEFAVHSARAEAVEGKVTPETTSGLSEAGFPIIWAVAWRVRSASWMLRHRALLEQAIA